MKITAYMNLLPCHIHLDLPTGAVCLDSSARGWNGSVHPDTASAAAVLSKDEATYAVTAELPDGTVFEVRGSVDQTEGRGGSYVAGLFDNFPAAHAAARGLGVQGQPGSITIHAAPVNVYSDVATWQAAFDLSEAREATTPASTSLISIVELASDDAAALGAAEPRVRHLAEAQREIRPQDRSHQMRITAFMNLSPEHVVFDERGSALRLTRKAFADSVPVCPTAELAAENGPAGGATYTVTADFDDSTVFEVLGRLEGVGSTFGTYTAGFFWDYADAFEAAAGLGAGGGRGEILVRPEITKIFDDFASWKAQFNVDAIASGPRSQDRIQMRSFVDIIGATA